MNCFYHNDRDAIGYCQACGQPLCQECGVQVDGSTICKSCVSETIKGGRARGPMATPMTRPLKTGNLLMYLFFSCIPGANYMYLGMMKRGCVVLGTLMASIYLTMMGFTGYYGEPFFVFGLFIGFIYIASFFDGLNIRAKLRAGIPVRDEVDDIKAFATKYKLPIVVTVGLIISSSMVMNLVYTVFHGYRSHFLLNFITWALIIFVGGTILLKKDIKKVVDIRAHGDND